MYIVKNFADEVKYCNEINGFVVVYLVVRITSCSSHNIWYTNGLVNFGHTLLVNELCNTLAGSTALELYLEQCSENLSVSEIFRASIKQTKPSPFTAAYVVFASVV